MKVNGDYINIHCKVKKNNFHHKDKRKYIFRRVNDYSLLKLLKTIFINLNKAEIK